MSLSALREYYDSLPNWAKYALATVPVVIVTKYVLTPRKRSSPVKKDFKKDLVYLYQYPRPKSLPSLSPFCLKLETWLRIANIEYENVECAAPFGVRSREGTLPFVELNGLEYPDSGLAIRDLTTLLSKEHIEDALSFEEQGQARAIEMLIESSIWMSYFYVRVTEKMDELAKELGVLDTTVFKIIKFFMKPIWQHRGLALFASTYIGKHDRDEVVALGMQDIKALAKCLGNKQFMMGDTPTRVDATAFGILAQIIYLQIDTPHLEIIKNDCPELLKYMQSMKERFWKDWDQVCDKEK